MKVGKPPGARRDANALEKRRVGADACKPRLHEPDRMRTPCVAVAAGLVLAAVRRLLRRRKALLHVVAPKVKTLQEEVAAIKFEVRLEEIVREVDGAALEVIVLDKMPERGLGLVLR